MNGFGNPLCGSRTFSTDVLYDARKIFNSGGRPNFHLRAEHFLDAGPYFFVR
jgi:hypothetical protein